MRVNTTKGWFKVNRGGKNIVFSDNLNILILRFDHIYVAKRYW